MSPPQRASVLHCLPNQNDSEPLPCNYVLFNHDRDTGGVSPTLNHDTNTEGANGFTYDIIPNLNAHVGSNAATMSPDNMSTALYDTIPNQCGQNTQLNSTHISNSAEDNASALYV